MATLTRSGDPFQSRVSRIVDAFARGLAQIAGAGYASPPKLYRTRGDSEALMTDWENVGSDLGRAMRMEREKV